MSSFWALSDNTQVKSETTFDQDGGTFEDIPNNTICQAYIEEVKWTKGFETEAELINVRWRVLAPQAYANRVLFQKLWVNGDDPSAKDPIKKGDNAKRMLGAIDANTGGGLPRDRSPNDSDLQASLLQKPMNIRVMQWAMGDKTGNWVASVSPRAAVVEEVAGAAKVQHTPQMQRTVAQEMDDSIPF